MTAGHLQRWLSLPLNERRQLLLLAVALPATSAALSLLGYKRTLDWLERRTLHDAPHDADAGELAAADRLAQLAAIAGRLGPTQQTCLRQALVVHAWLRWRGLRPQLKLGVAASRGAPDMHAWIELEGNPLAQAFARHQAFN